MFTNFGTLVAETHMFTANRLFRVDKICGSWFSGTKSFTASSDLEVRIHNKVHIIIQRLRGCRFPLQLN
jgi:hypothetical protein